MATEKPVASKPTSTAEALGGIAVAVLAGPVIAGACGLWLGLLWRVFVLAWGLWWW